MVALTAKLQQELQKAGGKPVRLTDPRSHQEYVLIQAQEYERMCRLLEVETVDPSLYEFEESPDHPG